MTEANPDSFTVGDPVIYRSPFDNEPKDAPATVVKVSEPWTTGIVPIKVRLRGARHEWTTARFLTRGAEA